MKPRKPRAPAPAAAQQQAMVPADSLASIERLLAALAKERIAAAGGEPADGDSAPEGLVQKLEQLASAHAQAMTQTSGEEEGAEDEAAGDQDAGEEEEDEGSTSEPNIAEDLEAKHQELMQNLEAIKEQRHGSGHEFGSAGNRGKTCGVCSATWSPDCDWEKGNGRWACFSCQVYICSWDCLNVHNKERTGNTVKGDTVIYKSMEEYQAASQRKRKKVSSKA